MTEISGETPGQQPTSQHPRPQQYGAPQEPYAYDPHAAQPPQNPQNPQAYDPQAARAPHDAPYAQPRQAEPTPAGYPQAAYPPSDHTQAGFPANAALFGPAPGPPGMPPAGFPPANKPPRRALRATLRWGAAVLLFAVAAGGTAYGLTEADRDALPGLATENDGRWDYPELELPALPAGDPRPFEEVNLGQVHHADVRDLMLPAPAGATPDKDLPGTKGWLANDAFVKIYEKGERDEVKQGLTDDAVRHIAASGWTMPDGTSTRIYLLQFNTGALAAHFYDEQLSSGVAAGRALTDSPETVVDESWSSKYGSSDIEIYVYDEAKPRDKKHVRQAYLLAGDTLALVVQAKPGTADRVPFQQTVILQHQLLG